MVALVIKSIIKLTKKVYKIISFNKLNELLKSETWSEIYCTKNANKYYENFICKIVLALSMITTIKTVNSKNTYSVKRMDDFWFAYLFTPKTGIISESQKAPTIKV